METDKIHLATISILIKNRSAKAPEVNDILTKHGEIIMSRLGLHLKEIGLANMTGLITVVAKAQKQQIIALTEDLDKIYGVVAKTNIFNE